MQECVYVFACIGCSEVSLTSGAQCHPKPPEVCLESAMFHTRSECVCVSRSVSVCVIFTLFACSPSFSVSLSLCSSLSPCHPVWVSVWVCMCVCVCVCVCFLSPPTVISTPNGSLSLGEGSSHKRYK